MQTNWIFNLMKSTNKSDLQFAENRSNASMDLKITFHLYCFIYQLYICFSQKDINLLFFVYFAFTNLLTITIFWGVHYYSYRCKRLLINSYVKCRIHGNLCLFLVRLMDVLTTGSIKILCHQQLGNKLWNI
jgi:hypothetical protein